MAGGTSGWRHLRKDDVIMSKQTPGSLNLLHVVMAESPHIANNTDVANAGIEQKLHTTNQENEIEIEDSKSRIR